MLPTKSPQTLSFCSVRKLNILLFFPSVLAKSFSKENGITYTESCPSGRRCSTRNAVSRKASRVRIPNSPPKSPVTKRFSGLFFFVRFRKTASKPPQEQPDFRKELRLFCLFRRIRTVKLGSFRRHMNFHSIYCRNSPFRATPFRLPLHLPKTVLTNSQGERKC